MKPNDPVAFIPSGTNKGDPHAETVSVIIPCYNQAHFVGEAIRSVLEQTHPYFEIIVVDDGSPDDIAGALKEYPQVKLLKQANAGAAIARNYGMAQSSGAYLVFLDSDDRLLPGALEVALNFFSQHPAIAFVTGAVQLIDKGGLLIETPFQPTVNDNHYKTLLKSNYIWTPGVIMYRRALFDNEKGFDPSAGGSADYELNIRLARKYPVGCHGRVVLGYRQHGRNMSSNYAYMLQSGVDVRRAQYPYVKGNADLTKAWREGIRIVQDDVGEKLLAEMLLADKPSPKELQILWKYYLKGYIKFLLKMAMRFISGRRSVLLLAIECVVSGHQF